MIVRYGDYAAELASDDRVTITNGVNYVGQGVWTNGTIDVWRMLLSEDVRSALELKLREAVVLSGRAEMHWRTRTLNEVSAADT